MRYQVIGREQPFDPIGYLPGPPPEELTAAKFRWRWPVQAVMNDHPHHWDVKKRGTHIELEAVHWRHEDDCPCIECKKGRPPTHKIVFHQGRYDIVELRHIRGFHPLQVLYAEPAGTSAGSTLF